MALNRVNLCLLFSLFIGGCQSVKTPELELLATEKNHQDANYPELILGGCHYTDGEFKMMIQGISLGVRTPVLEKRKGASLNKGNYLHLVLNDSFHSIHHDRNVRMKIPDGQYKASAFVARDYHESVKNEQAFMCRNIQIKNGQMVRSMKSEEARLLYGGPWGSFKNEDADYILLDFYLMNTNLSPQGNKVRLLIDEQKEFLIDDWKSYYIKGLSAGVHHIQLELINADGQQIYGPLKQKINCVFKE